MQADFLLPPPELGRDLRGKQLRTAAGHTDIQVGEAEQVVEGIEHGDGPALAVPGVGDRPAQPDLVGKEAELLLPSFDKVPHMGREGQRIPESGVLGRIEAHDEDALFRDPVLHEISPVLGFQEKGFPATAHADNDFHEPILAGGDELAQAALPCDFPHDDSYLTSGRGPGGALPRALPGKRPALTDELSGMFGKKIRRIKPVPGSGSRQVRDTLSDKTIMA